MNYAEAVATFRADKPYLQRKGINWMPGAEVHGYYPEEWKNDLNLAMDAQPTLFTAPTSAVPAILTTMIDPQVYEILFTPSRAAEILGEVKRGDWLMDVTLFPVVEGTGEVSSYGDFNNNGRAGLNVAWPQRQSYLFQVIKEYGDRESERAGLAKINWMTEIDKSAAMVMQKFLNYTYFFGVAGIQNYGLLNDPNLSAPITPAAKAAGGTAWVVAGRINATANEIYADFQALFYDLVSRTRGLITRDSPLILALDPGIDAIAMTTTNSFNVSVTDLLKKNYPNIKIVTATQYGVTSATNPQGIAAGNLVQLIAPQVEGQQTGFAAFNEKMRAHPVIRHMSSSRQKVTGGTWGSVLRFPAGVAALVGV